MLVYPVSRLAPVLVSLMLVACGGGSSSNPDNTNPDQSLEDDPTVPQAPVVTDAPEGPITGVSIGSSEGEYFPGTPPVAVGSVVLQPLASDQRNVSLVSGGSVEVGLDTDTQFSTVYVVVDEDSYFSVQLSETTNSTSLVISGREDIDLDSDLVLSVQVGTPLGDISEAVPLELSPLQVGTGDLQVSVSWDTPTDVDLYLIEPSGQVISFLNGLSDAGGMMDLDSNPDCEIDGYNNENINYEGSEPAIGEYVAGVRYYSDCDVEALTNFVVTVRIDGVPQTYSGQLVPGDSGGERAVEVVRFTYP